MKTDTTSSTNHLVQPDRELDAAIKAARLAAPVVEAPGNRKLAFVPSDFVLTDISDPDRLRSHIRQKITVSDRHSLIAYCNRYSDTRSILIANYDESAIVARLDWHKANDADNPLAPQQNRHLATLCIRESEEFARWSAMEGTLHTQQDFAIFIEENVADVVDPSHGQLLEVCRDLEATQGAAFKSRTRLENGDMSFKYETETRVTNDVVVPHEIHLSIPLYHGEEPTEIKAKFRFRATSNGLLLGFIWHRVEYQRQAKFREMAFDASEHTGLPVFFGAAPEDRTQ